jgi:hypothetical protein
MKSHFHLRHYRGANEPYNFTGMREIYSNAIRAKEPTIAFELRNGRGRFLFMMFFSEDDEESRDALFVFLLRTQVLLRLKMYGSHRKGDFNVYFTDTDILKIRQELELEQNTTLFEFRRFLGGLNSQIPANIPFAEQIGTLRENRAIFQNDSRLRRVIDEESKIYFTGVIQLPDNKHPREKTLRKLYLHLDANPQSVHTLIQLLKQRNCTVGWSDVPSAGGNSFDFESIR